MSYPFQTKDMSVSRLVDMDVSRARDFPAASRYSPAGWLNNRHTMWLAPVILGFVLLAIAAAWFSTLGTFYSTGLEGIAGETIAGWLPLPL